VDCKEARELLSPVSDHEATKEEIGLVEEHLRTCRECAFESTMILGLRRLLENWDGVRATEEFRSRLLDRVRTEPGPKAPGWPGWRPLAWGAGIVLGGGLVLALSLWLAGGPQRSGEAAVPDAGATSADGPAVAAGRGPADAPVVAGAWPAAGEGSASSGGAALPAAGDAGPGAAKEPVAQLDTTQSVVYVDRPGSVPAIASAGDVLRPGQGIRVSEKAWAEAELTEALLRMRLNGGAEYVFASGGYQGELRAGEVLYAPLAYTAAAGPYRVKCGKALVEFDSAGLRAGMERTADAGLKVVVAEGRAVVLLPVGKYVLSAGQRMLVGPDGSATPPSGAPSEYLERVVNGWSRR